MTPSSIPLEEVEFFTSASPVHGARLFRWQGELFRAVRPGAEKHYRRMFSEGIIEKLIEKGYVVETEPVDVRLDGYPMVLKHRRLPFVTYPFEWSAEALREAGLMLIDFNLELAAHGLVTKDAHAWNILYDGPRPVFVDVDSIVPLEEANLTNVISELQMSFEYPLRLMALGQRRVTRCLIKDKTRPISHDEFAAISEKYGFSPRNYLRKAYHDLERVAPRRLKESKFLRSIAHRIYPPTAKRSRELMRRWPAPMARLRAKLEVMDLSLPDTTWTRYREGQPPIDQRDQWRSKQVNFAAVIDRLRPRTVLDVGGNTGWYSRYATGRGACAIVTDVDEACLDRLFLEVKASGEDVFPIYLNIVDPSSAMGWSATRYPGAQERLEAECVFALALIHHLVFKQMADFDQVVDGLARLSSKDLIVEFVPRQDSYVREWWNDGYAWYTLDNLLSRLENRFEEVSVLPSVGTERSLIVCRKLRPF